MFEIQDILVIAAGLALIKWSQEVADWLSTYVGTSLIRDLDNPFVMKILGIFLIGSTLFFWLI